MLKVIKRLLLLSLVFAAGWAAKPSKVREVVTTIHTPPTVVMPVSNFGVEVNQRMRWVNVEASVPIFVVQDEETLQKLIGFTGDGFLEGAYAHEGKEAIYILGNWGLEAETALHEYTHMLEANIPESAWKIRRTFHKLCSDKFRIDAEDLEPDLPEPVMLGPAGP